MSQLERQTPWKSGASSLCFDAVSHAELASVSGILDAGMNVLLGSQRDGTASVVLLASGMVQPARGRILLDGSAPFSHRRVRRAIGSLCAEEQLPAARTAGAALELALRARADARSALSVLDAAGLAHLAPRRIARLSARETRAVALALALSHSRPSLLALHEPLALLGMISERFLFDALRGFAAGGSVVLVTVDRVADALRVGGEVHALERGIWLDSAAHRTPLAELTLRVQTPEAERLLASLAEAPKISGVTRAGSTELLVRGRDLESVASSVVTRARGAAIRIEALHLDPPALEPFTAASGNRASASALRPA